MSDKLAQRHQVVVIGSGFGALWAVKKLRRVNADVTLISRSTTHVFQPLLYQVATAILSEGEIAPATREITTRIKNLRILLGEVTDIDVSAHTVTSRARGVARVTHYDSIIVAAGAVTSYFGNDDFATYAPGLKSIDDALECRSRILSAFEYAALATDDQERDEWLTFAVVGAGATGVEMAGQIAELAHRALPKQFNTIDTRKTRILLVDAMGTVLSAYTPKLSAGATKQLERLGIEVWLEEKVVGVDEHGLTVEDKSNKRTRIPARTIIWAAGVAGSPLANSLAEQTGAGMDHGNRVKVGPDCTLPGHPEVFVVGDMMSLNDYPGVAQVAMQQGTYAAKAIDRTIRGQAPQKPFHYFDKGTMATVSRFKAVAIVGPFAFGGLIAWLLWLVVHIFYLIGFKNRITTLLHWAVSFLGRGRAQRATSSQEMLARDAIETLGLNDDADPSGVEADETAAAHGDTPPTRRAQPSTTGT